MTTHIEVEHRPVFAAFVNKGKSTPKVLASKVSHQISRLGRFPNIDVIVLLAVGEIYDDVKVDLLQTAGLIDADYLIVDVLDVARLFIAYQFVCPKDGNPFIDGKCPVCGGSAEKPIELTISVREELARHISQSDNSTGIAKRYSANVVTDRHYGKAAIREVIKETIWELRHSDYYRSDITRVLFGDQEAEVVWLFVYLDESDREQHNWICRAQWISENLTGPARPKDLNGNDHIGAINIEWNSMHQARRETLHRRSKREWFEDVDSLVPRMESTIARVQTLYGALRSGTVEEVQFFDSMAEVEQASTQLYLESGSSHAAPLECAIANQSYQQAITSFSNVSLPFRRQKSSWKQMDWHLRTYLDQFEQDLQRLKLDLERVR